MVTTKNTGGCRGPRRRRVSRLWQLPSAGAESTKSCASSACIEAWRVKYLVDLEVPAPGTISEADSKPFTG